MSFNLFLILFVWVLFIILDIDIASIETHINLTSQRVFDNFDNIIFQLFLSLASLFSSWSCWKYR